jgi:hypothetical protein
VRRRRIAESSSLELLLDTICNTFGGIVFISLLVVILLNLTGEDIQSEPVSQEDQTHLARLTQELTETTRTLDALREAAARQQAMANEFGSKEVKALIKEIKQLQVELLERSVESNRDASESANMQMQLNDAESMRQQFESLMRKLHSLQEQYERETAARSEAVRPSTEFTTTKEQIGFFLKSGRLYSYAKKGPRGKLIPNDDDCTVEPDASSGGLAIKLKPGRGIPIKLSAPVPIAVSQTLSQFDKDAQFLDIWVWPDSFEHFALVQDELSRLGFTYNFRPITDDETVPVGTAPATTPHKVMQ